MAATPSAPPAGSPPTPEVTLYSVPVSNYGARVRLVAIAKGLVADGRVAVASPATLGGLKSDAFAALHPFGKMPAAVVWGGGRPVGDGGGAANATDGGGATTTTTTPDLHLYESSVLTEYLADAYDDVGPSFVPPAAADRARARLVVAVLNEYVGPHHPAMYKALEGVDAAGRAAGVARLRAGLDAVEAALHPAGPYAAGAHLSVADAAVVGNWPFYAYMLPTFFGEGPGEGRPRLAACVDHLLRTVPAAREVYADVHAALEGWWEGGRWEKLGMEAVAPPPGLPF